MTDTTVVAAESTEDVNEQTDETTPEDDEQSFEPGPQLDPEAAQVRPSVRPGPIGVSPDGTMLAYLMPASQEPEAELGLWLQPADGGEARRLELDFTPLVVPDPTGDTSADEGPQWSPDGTTIAFTGAHPLDGWPAIFLVSGFARPKVAPVEAAAAAETGEVVAAEAGDAAASEPVAGEPAEGAEAEPTEAAELIAMAVEASQPEAANEDGDKPTTRLLIDHPAADRGPRWSPDGSMITFTSHRAGRDTICVAPVDGFGPAMPLTNGLYEDRDPAWSRDGSEVAFRRAIPGHPTDHDIWVIKLATGEEKQVTNIPGKATSKPANRRAPRWAPNRSLIAFITDEKDYDAIAVVNPDNNAGWTLADEPGDKSNVSWSPNGLRITYTRRLGPISNVCARGTSASRADILDPGDGQAYSSRWLSDGRAVYAYSAPNKQVRFYTQEAKLDVERTELPLPVAWDGPEAGLVKPATYEVETGDGAKLSGLIYRKVEVQGPTPAVVGLGDGPPLRQEATFDPLYQTLALAGMAVYTPNLRGTPGSGRAVADGLRTFADQEVEAADLADIGAALQALPDVMEDRVAIVGRGYGGTLALLAAASRPGHYSAVVAVDPITDWEVEVDAAGEPWRTWLLRQLGLPVQNTRRYNLRTPYTFAALLGLLDAPLLLIGTEDAPPGRAAQLEAFAATLAELEVPHKQLTVADAVIDVARATLEHLRGAYRRDALPETLVDAASATEPVEPIEAAEPVEFVAEAEPSEPSEAPEPVEAAEEAVAAEPVEAAEPAEATDTVIVPEPVVAPAPEVVEVEPIVPDAAVEAPPPSPADQNGSTAGMATKPDDV